MMNTFESLPQSIVADVKEKWNSFLNTVKAHNIDLSDNPSLLSETYSVWGLSEFVLKSCLFDPMALVDLIQSGDLKQPYAENGYEHRIASVLSMVTNEASLMSEIRRFRRREMVRIAWRDLSGAADLEETMGDLTRFADACVKAVVSQMYQWQCLQNGIPTAADGTRQHLIVLGMGKLGGMELNFSSDIDLIFAYPDPGQTIETPQPIPNEEFFVRLCRKLVKALGAKTDQGLLFRVDTRLRPIGEGGPIVMSFDNMVEYYERQGREWERYAWIKARVVAGDPAAGKRLLDRLSPFVYRRYLDYGAFESLRDMKSMITREVKRKGLKDNIKLGPGGIREVEFFGQVFQLIRGGVLPVLQERRIQRVLSLLALENYIPDEVCDELTTAYIFLRRTENRLQEAADQQTHGLPTGATERLLLAISMGYSDWEAFFKQLAHHMERVHSHFDKLLEARETVHSEKDGKDDLFEIFRHPEETEKNFQLLQSAGFSDPKAVLHLMENLRDDAVVRSLRQEGKDRLGKLIPLVLKEVSASENPVPNLNRIFDLIRAVGGRTNYLALLLENPSALTHLVTLANASPWVISFLTRHPVLLDELLDPRTLYTAPERRDLEKELKRKFAYLADQDPEYQIEELCVFKQVNTLKVAAADVTGALPLMRVSDHLSYIAESILAQVLDMAWGHLIERHGLPACHLSGTACERGFAVIAYGKLGGLELGYDSDLDLVFLHAGDDANTQDGNHPIDNTQFFARLGQRMVHILTTHTAAGFLYETDMRLRPSGGSGPLVSHIEGFKSYQLDEAWIWEHQALVRARAVCGDPALITYFEILRRDVLTRSRDRETLAKDVGKMRARLRKELLNQQPGIFDLRQAAGAMVDIEFLVQYLLLLHAHQFPELTHWTDNVRILGTLAETGVLDPKTAHLLRNAYLVFRSVLHKLSLQEKAAVISEDRFKDFRKIVIDIWNQHLGSVIEL